MEINLSKRLLHLSMVYNQRMDAAYAGAIRKFGEDGVLALTIGDPDQPPHKSVIDALIRIAADIFKHGYVIPAFGSRKLLKAAADFRKRVHGIDLDSRTQVCSVHGSRKGLFDVLAATTDPGDGVMLPGMFYPGSRNAVIMSYCKPYYYSVLPGTDPFAEMQKCYALAKEDNGRPPKVCLIVSVGNPFGSALPESFFPKAISFARQNNLILLDDEAYLCTVFQGKKAFSLMNFEGGSSVGVSIYTMSKKANVPSHRSAFVDGNAEIIDGLKRVVASLEYGLPWWIQEATMAALAPECDEYPQHCAADYERRHKAVTETAAEYGIEVWPVDGGMFAALVIPPTWAELGSREVAAKALEETGVRVNAGIDHGEEADCILRIALVKDEETLRAGCSRLCAFLSKPRVETEVPEDTTTSYIV